MGVGIGCQNPKLTPIAIFVASPSDVASERAHVAEVAAALNRTIAAERDVYLKVVGYQTDVRPRTHSKGPQGPIDEDLPIEKCDIVIGILWNLIGTPMPEYGGKTGTEHEIHTAIAAPKPEVVVYFNEEPYRLKNVDAAKQATRVLEFREEIQGLHPTYNGPADFREKIRQYLEQYLIDKHPPKPGKPAPTISGDPARYLKAMREETSHFDVQGLKFGDNRAYRFPIEEFYIPLTTGGNVPLQEALLAHRKLLVVGDPGSGKSTFLKRVAFQLCKEYETGGLLPIRIEAAVLSRFLEQHLTANDGPADPKSPEWLPIFLGAHCREHKRGLSRDYFDAQLTAGACHVLIDGLDETPDEPSRERLAKLIHGAAAAFDQCRFTVTSRPEGKVPIADFEEALIADLEPKAITGFLAKLAHQLYPDNEPKEREFREDLESAVNGRREIRKMTRNPVMLTALAVLQHNHVKLPEKRVDLYGSILHWLAKQRAKPGRLPAADCLLRLRELALEMQTHEKGRQKQVPLAWAGEKLAGKFANRETAERFLVKEQADSGIVVSCGRDIAYWHLTFQEYLAALEIFGWGDAAQYKLLLAGRGPKIYKPEWRETAMLYGGLLYNAGPPKVDALVRKLLDKMGNDPSLAIRARCVGLIGALLPDLVGYTVSDPRYQESLRQVMDIFDAEKSKAVPFKDRLAAAEALGPSDSRLAKHEWVTIPASKNYWIGAQKKDPKGRNYDDNAYDQEPLRQVNLPPFRIGKYPVTVSQYQKFVEDGNPEPATWESQLDHPNWPVVDVDWHQANAYATSLGARLPAEEEWERAARGPKGTIYPWGTADIDPSRANFGNSGIGHPTPVGLYPSGSSAEGALDLIGNVLEWTSSKWSEGTEHKVWRGGSFDDGRRLARSSFRSAYLPDEHNQNLSFRLAGGIT